MNKNLIYFLLITHLSGQLYAGSTYLFCKADNSLNPGYERVEYTAIELFNNWKIKPDGREYSGGCQREMTAFDKIISYPKQNIRANFFKGDPYCGKDSGGRFWVRISLETPFQYHGNKMMTYMKDSIIKIGKQQ